MTIPALHFRGVTEVTGQHLGNEKRGVTADRRPRATGSTWSADTTLKPGVARASSWRYGSPRVANKAARRGTRRTISTKAHQRPHTIAGAFFVPAMRSYGGTYRAGLSVSFVAGSVPVPPRYVPSPKSRGTDSDGSLAHKGTRTMQHIPARSPSTASTRAAAHRAMALAALHADSSLAVRLRRFNRHMAIARSLESQEVAL